ncbi:uncharacterized protein LOC115892813 [Rhinopithecus roxellana]|uniref:uncharacterized protein LOC115892813 n=1 Tax=Rhinopithecus roxellana TaxID=61622 RepID=UPI0012374901|nr:uncharacterized protein LOC115892813 [Rhinopithecus roxellana]
MCAEEALEGPIQLSAEAAEHPLGRNAGGRRGSPSRAAQSCPPAAAPLLTPSSASHPGSPKLGLLLPSQEHAPGPALQGPVQNENITPWPKVTKNFQTARAEREVSTGLWGLPRWQEEVASLGPLWPLPGPSHHPISPASQLWFLPLPHPASGPVSLWASHTAWDRKDFLFYPRLFRGHRGTLRRVRFLRRRPPSTGSAVNTGNGAGGPGASWTGTPCSEEEPGTFRSSQKAGLVELENCVCEWDCCHSVDLNA